MLRVLIIEDESGVRKDIIGLLKLRKDIIVIGEAASVAIAETLIKSTQPDVILLDIHLEDGTAFELLSKFTVIDFSIIFITAFDNFAIKAIKIGALDYLLKPVDIDELFAALDRANDKLNIATKEQITYTIENADNTKPDKFIVKTVEGIHIIHYDEVIYCKSEGAYTFFHLLDGRLIIASKSIKEYEDVLSDDVFVRCHQSYIVNLKQAIKIDREDNLVLRDGSLIPIATRRKEMVIQMITK
jgi:two-component system LytT family response regulator